MVFLSSLHIAIGTVPISPLHFNGQTRLIMAGHFENVADGKQALINRVLFVSVAAACLQVSGCAKPTRKKIQQGLTSNKERDPCVPQFNYPIMHGR